MGEIPFQREKFQELILYIAKRMEEDNHAGRGRIKLAKLMWRSDFAAFWKLGEPITGATYHADKLGPSPRDELLMTRDLEVAGDFRWENDWDRQELPIAMRSADVGVFKPEELELIDSQLDKYRFVTSKAMVDEAHTFAGWKHAWNAGRHEPIPYASVFWDDRRELETWEEEYALSLASTLGSGAEDIPF